MVTSPDIENQKLFLMFDAVSAHTDCLIQIVKERRNSVLLREWNSTQPPSRVKPYFQRLFEVIDSGFALPLALSMEAHYRDLDHACKGVFELNSHFWFNRSLITQKAHLSCNNTPVWRARYPLDGVAMVADQGCGDLVSLHLYAW
ncbi:hypothetical protein ACET6W_11090 [Aeromonas veronii]